MGGGASQTENSSSALASTEANIAQQYLTQSQGQIAAGQNLEQPLINFYQGITSGNTNNLLTAAAPQIGNITQQNQAAQASIWNNTPAGAGRDFALSQAKVNQGGQVASTLNSTYNGALTGLAQLGAAQTGVGLSEAGAGISGISGAQSAYGNVEQTQQAQKSSLISSLGSIVGGVGGAAVGNFSQAGGTGMNFNPVSYSTGNAFATGTGAGAGGGLG